MLSHAESWLYGELAGIRFDMSAPEDKRISIAPQPVGGVGAAMATNRSVLGDVACA
jgi:hypothetical protein